MSTPGSHERWDERYATAPGAATPALFLSEVEHLLPTAGSMLDVAGGSGRNAVWFAERGYEATVVDFSEHALGHAESLAAERGVQIETMQRDLETDGLPPDRVWDLALMHLFSRREVLVSLPSVIRGGGLLLFAQPTVINLERHDRPGRRFLLHPGELAEIVESMSAIEVVELSEAWRDSGRHEARLVARKRRASDGSL